MTTQCYVYVLSTLDFRFASLIHSLHFPMENLVLVPIYYIVATKMVDSVHIRCTQLLFATTIEGGIHDCQVLKY